MIQALGASERDKQWLAAHGHSDLDSDDFSEWVCRMMADGMSEIDARFFVLKEILNNKTASRPG